MAEVLKQTKHWVDSEAQGLARAVPVQAKVKNCFDFNYLVHGTTGPARDKQRGAVTILI